MRIESDVKLDFDDVLIRPKRSKLKSRKEVDLNRTFRFKHSGASFCGIPIIASNMDTVGTIDVARKFQTLGLFTWLHRFYTSQQIYDANLDMGMCAVSIGEKEMILPPRTSYIRVDVANGYRECFVDRIKEIRDIVNKAEPRYPPTIFAGNVCTPEMTEELILAGADVIVVGVGPGGQCITRDKAAIGYPQLSAIIECADAAHGLNGHIVADGGCRTPGDICKAFGAGADFVCLGSMLAGHTENTTEIVNKYGYPWNENSSPFESQNKKYAKTYGMSSETAMNKHSGGVDDHKTSEGKTSLVPFKGPIEDTIKDILGGLRSCCSYVGATQLRELTKRTTFIKVNRIRNTHYEQYKVGE